MAYSVTKTCLFSEKNKFKFMLSHSYKCCIEHASNEDFEWPFKYSFLSGTVKEWNKLGNCLSSFPRDFSEEIEYLLTRPMTV